jgi:hypothetical protein
MQSIVEFYKLGVELNGEFASRAKAYGRGTIHKYATKKKMSAANLQVARQLARVYSQDEVVRLSTPKRGKHAIGIGHLRELILVKSDKARQKLQDDAIEKGWSVRELRAKRKARLGVAPQREYAGAKPRLPKSSKEALRQLEERLSSLLRWVNLLQEPAHPHAKPTGRGGKSSFQVRYFPPEIHTALAKAVDELDKLRAIVKKNSISERQ